MTQQASESLRTSTSSKRGGQNSGEKLLELRQVSKVYKGHLGLKSRPAVENLTLALGAGEVTGLLGANGAGKTTSIRLMLGLTRPTSGQVLFEGRTLRIGDMAQIGYMPEVSRLPQSLTCEELLFDALTVHKPAFCTKKSEMKQTVADGLKAVGLKGHEKKRVGQLSKGMGRRLAFALATLHRPKLLILDEPTSGLDPVGRMDLLQQIASIKATGTTILLCTHELNHVASLCDAFFVLRGGRLVHQQSRNANSGSDFSIAVSGATPEVLGQVAEKWRLTQAQQISVHGFSLSFQIDSYEEAARWIAALINEGVLLLSFGPSVRDPGQELLKFFVEEGP